jgi:hypothetical protein
MHLQLPYVRINDICKGVLLGQTRRRHGGSKTENGPWQKQIETKTRWEHDIQTSDNLGGYIGESLTTKRRHRRKPGWKRAPRQTHQRMARPAGGPHQSVVWGLWALFLTHFCLVIFHI